MPLLKPSGTHAVWGRCSHISQVCGELMSLKQLKNYNSSSANHMAGWIRVSGLDKVAAVLDDDITIRQLELLPGDEDSTDTSELGSELIGCQCQIGLSNYFWIWPNLVKKFQNL